MVDYEIMNALLSEKIKRFRESSINIPYSESKTKVNLVFPRLFESEECYRELLVSWYQLAPLVTDQVKLEEADYILFFHPYARCDDLSEDCAVYLRSILDKKKPGARVILGGKVANLETKYDFANNKDLIFIKSNYIREIGKIIGANIADQHIVYDDIEKKLNIWPVDGCMQQCNFCRRCYMDIPFESQKMEDIKAVLDNYKREHPEQMQHVSLRAENLTEYGIDIYGNQDLPRLLKLINSYDEVKEITLDIGMSIGEMTEEILDTLDECNKVSLIAINLEAGTDRLLKVINKKHTVERAKYVAKRLRSKNPNLKIVSTVMIGLPTESIGDVHALSDLILDVGVDILGINYYIPNEGDRLDKTQLPRGKERIYHLEEMLNRLTDIKHNDSVRKAIEKSSEAHPTMEVHCYSEDNRKRGNKRKFKKELREVEESNCFLGFFPKHLSIEHCINYYKGKQLIEKLKGDERE